jgi:hypothetical protein
MGGITADCADFTLFTNPVAILSNMYTHFVTVLPLIVMVVSTLATPDLAGRNHGLRRRGLSGRAWAKQRIRLQGKELFCCISRFGLISRGYCSGRLFMLVWILLIGQATGGGSSSMEEASVAATSAVSAVTSAISVSATTALPPASVTTPAASDTVTTSVPPASAVSSSTSDGSTSASGKAALTPNGIKAGMTLCTGLDDFTGKLGWCYGMSSSHSPFLHPKLTTRLDTCPFPSIWYGGSTDVMGRWIEF